MPRFVALNGSGTANTASTTLTFTTSRIIQSGEHVVVVSNSGGGGSDPNTITVGSLSLIKDKSQGTNTSLSMWSARALVPIASGSNVTQTWGVGPTNRQGICFSLYDVAQTNYVDQTASAGFIGGSPPFTGTTPFTTIRDEIAIAAVGWRSAVNMTPNVYTEITEVNDAGGANTHVEACYKVLTTTGMQSESWVDPGTFGDAMIVTYAAPVGLYVGRPVKRSRGISW